MKRQVRYEWDHDPIGVLLGFALMAVSAAVTVAVLAFAWAAVTGGLQ